MVTPYASGPNPQPSRGPVPGMQPLPAQSGPASAGPTPTQSNLPVSGIRRSAATSSADGPGAPRKSGFSTMLLAAVGVVACLAAGIWFAPRTALDEKSHANWQHAERAAQESRKAGETQLVTVANGAVALLTTIKLDSKPDPATTTKVTAALNSGQPDAVQQVIADAQQVPAIQLVQTGERLYQSIKPQISEGLKAELLKGDAKFFHLYMYDCCAEDGDVIEVQLDNQPFAIVPITHAGATLSVPLVAGKVTALAIRGVRDGGGGITVAFATDDGAAFLGVLDVDQVVPLGVVGK